MPQRGPSEFEPVIKWLSDRERVLIVSHVRPDGDALGSLFGAIHMLRAQGLDARAYVTSEVPDRGIPRTMIPVSAGSFPMVALHSSSSLGS